MSAGVHYQVSVGLEDLGGRSLFLYVRHRQRQRPALEHVLLMQLPFLLADAHTVDEGARRAAQVAHHPALTLDIHLGVLLADGWVIEDDVLILLTSDLETGFGLPAQSFDRVLHALQHNTAVSQGWTPL